jgi:hypothetical protein
MVENPRRKFATILLFAIIQAVAASFVVFLVMADTIGPAKPTKLADRLVAHCRGRDSIGGVTKTGGETTEGALQDELVHKANAVPTNYEIWKGRR